MYSIKVRLGDQSRTLTYESRGRMVTEASRYAEQGYIVMYSSEG